MTHLRTLCALVSLSLVACGGRSSLDEAEGAPAAVDRCAAPAGPDGSWSRSIGQPPRWCFVFECQLPRLVDVATDADGGIVVATAFRGEVDLGCVKAHSVGRADLLVAKFDVAGRALWARSFGQPGTSVGAPRVGVDAAGRIVVFGGGDLTFEDGTTANGSFALALEPDGSFRWAKAFPTWWEGVGASEGASGAVSPSGLVASPGSFEGDVVINGQAFSSSSPTPFVALWDPDGAPIGAFTLTRDGGTFGGSIGPTRFLSDDELLLAVWKVDASKGYGPGSTVSVGIDGSIRWWAASNGYGPMVARAKDVLVPAGGSIRSIALDSGALLDKVHIPGSFLRGGAAGSDGRAWFAGGVSSPTLLTVSPSNDGAAHTFAGDEDAAFDGVAVDSSGAPVVVGATVSNLDLGAAGVITHACRGGAELSGPCATLFVARFPR